MRSRPAPRILTPQHTPSSVHRPPPCRRTRPPTVDACFGFQLHWGQAPSCTRPSTVANGLCKRPRGGANKTNPAKWREARSCSDERACSPHPTCTSQPDAAQAPPAGTLPAYRSLPASSHSTLCALQPAAAIDRCSASSPAAARRAQLAVKQSHHAEFTQGARAQCAPARTKDVWSKLRRKCALTAAPPPASSWHPPRQWRLDGGAGRRLQPWSTYFPRAPAPGVHSRGGSTLLTALACLRPAASYGVERTDPAVGNGSKRAGAGGSLRSADRGRRRRCACLPVQGGRPPSK